MSLRTLTVLKMLPLLGLKHEVVLHCEFIYVTISEQKKIEIIIATNVVY